MISNQTQFIEEKFSNWSGDTPRRPEKQKTNSYSMMIMLSTQEEKPSITLTFNRGDRVENHAQQHQRWLMKPLIN
ncbi:hypothetical protein O9929_14180 [Vibrio lentus]|nr:hypothetical protein [Vibrio lentus]